MIYLFYNTVVSLEKLEAAIVFYIVYDIMSKHYLFNSSGFIILFILPNIVG